MGKQGETATSEAIYEVLFDEMSVESLRSTFPRLVVDFTRTQTLLRRRIDHPDQLDAFLDQLFCWGLHLEEVHRLTSRPGEGPVYEVRVAGELRPSMLRQLGASYGFVPRQARVVLIAVTTGLHDFLRLCTEGGAKINRVRRSEETKLPAAAYRIDSAVDA